MKMIEYTCTEFSEILASEAPTPGGGSVAALSGAFGSALTAMVASLTVGREKYAEYGELAEEIISIANHLRLEFLTAVDADAAAFEAVSDAMKLPKETAEQKVCRKLAVQAALKNATEVPLGVMELSLRALELTKKAVGKSNINAVSDLGAAALSLRSALCGAWLNVLINLGSIKDSGFIESRRNRGLQIMDIALPLADEIYRDVLLSVTV